MGIGKLGKRLDKMARKARKSLGRRGKELSEAVLERAISILESELKGADAAKSAAPGEQKARGKEKARGSTKPKGRSRATGTASASAARREGKPVAKRGTTGRSGKARAGGATEDEGEPRAEPTSAD